MNLDFAAIGGQLQGKLTPLITVERQLLWTPAELWSCQVLQ
jgi:hypothetical protein